jgi:membrane fusion protein (multidrug efflux system)
MAESAVSVPTEATVTQIRDVERARGGAASPVVARKDGEQPHAPVTTAPAAAPKKTSRKKLVFGVLLLAALGGGAWYGYDWWQVGRFLVSTDDAYVDADISILSAKVGGHITAIDVAANQPVKAGDVIARIDDVDYKLALQAAEGKIATEQAAIDRFGRQIEAAKASVDAARAQLAAGQAELERAKLEFSRKEELARSQFSSQATLDTARADRDKAVAAVDEAQASVASAGANVAVLEAQRTEAERVLDEYKIARDQAQRDLDFTVIKAPFDGVVGNRAVEVGQLVQPGTRITALVPANAAYIDANFKETQLGRLHEGQAVNVEIDAYPGEEFEGHVASVAPASGSVFSLLPPENATGNFTKIVQRVPVRVELDAASIAKAPLRPGMSVVAIVDTRTGD